MKKLMIGLMGMMVAALAIVAEPMPPAEAGSRVVMEWNTFQQVTGWNPENRSASDEGKFVVPWTDIENLFGITITNMQTAELKLPWQEFKALLEWNVREEERKRIEDAATPPAPTPYLITSTDFVGDELSEDGARFTATMKIDLLREKGWQKINILPGNVAVSKATLPENVYLQLEGNNYYLLTKSTGQIEVVLEFSVPVRESGGSYNLSFNKVPSGTCLVDVTVPMGNAEINISGAQSKLSKSAEDQTRITAALPAGSGVSISWERSIPEAEKVPPKLYAQTRTLIAVGDGILMGRSQVAFNILHSGTRQLTLNVPAGASIYEVNAPSIRDWRVSGDKLVIQLSREIIGAFALDIKYESPITSGGENSQLPVITAEGVQRDKGHIAIVALTNVEISGHEAVGANSIDVKDLPPELMGMTSQPVLLGYRYVEPGFKVGLKISKHPDVAMLLTVVDSAHFTVMQTRDGRRITKARYNVRNNRNQFLRLSLPEGASIWSASVAGKATQPAKDETGRLLLPLVRSQGRGGLSSFPVEIVYAEEGQAPDAKGRGSVRVALPNCSEPITHMLVDLYVPKKGRYSSFTGTLRNVKEFTNIGLKGVQINVAQQVGDIQGQAIFNQQQLDSNGGEAAIEVQLPITGTIYRFEKILVLDEDPWFGYTFSGLK